VAILEYFFLDFHDEDGDDGHGEGDGHDRKNAEYDVN
jgi:hypothetical protein